MSLYDGGHIPPSPPNDDSEPETPDYANRRAFVRKALQPRPQPRPLSPSSTFSRTALLYPDEAKPDITDFPDGGVSAWVSVIGAWCCMFVSVGWISCIGDFQAYYQGNQLSAYSPSTIGWIPSTQAFLLYALAPVFGRIFDIYGPRPLLIVGTVCHIAGLLLLSISTQYYQIFLTQSICSASGTSAIFWAAGLTVNTWFRRRRALAAGLAASGSSIGGAIGTAVIPILFRGVGFGNTLRAISFAYLCLLFVAILTLQSRLQHGPSAFRISRFLEPLREWPILFLSLAGFFLSLGIFLPYNFMVVDGLASGMSHIPAHNLLVILNAAGLLGRIALPWAGDRFGPFNITFATTLAASVVVLAMWLPATSDAVRNGFAALYGILSAALLSILGPLVAQVCPDIQKIGTYTGATFLAISPAMLITLPIGGGLVTNSGSFLSPYFPAKIFCGVVLCVSGVFFAIARASHLRVRREILSKSGEDLPCVRIRLILS